MKELRRRLLNVLVALDQFVYVLCTLGHGSPDETISSALWRTERDGKVFGAALRPVVDAAFRLIGDADHCRKAYESERRQLSQSVQRG